MVCFINLCYIIYISIFVFVLYNECFLILLKKLFLVASLDSTVCLHQYLVSFLLRHSDCFYVFDIINMLKQGICIQISEWVTDNFILLHSQEENYCVKG